MAELMAQSPRSSSMFLMSIERSATALSTDGLLALFVCWGEGRGASPEGGVHLPTWMLTLSLLIKVIMVFGSDMVEEG